MKIHRNHRWPKGLCAAVLAIAAFVDIAHGAAAGHVIFGDIGEAVEGGEVILLRPGAAPGASHVLTRTPIRDGRFRIVGEVTDNKVDASAAAGLDDETYRLKDALAENKLVLIEFWADRPTHRRWSSFPKGRPGSLAVRVVLPKSR